MCFEAVCCRVNEKNWRFDRRMLHHKIMCEIKKTESGNDCSVERRFPNSGCFWNAYCVGGTLKQMPRWSRKLGVSFDIFQRKSLKPPFLKMAQKNGSMFSCKLMEFRDRICQMYGLWKWGWCEGISLCFRSFFYFLSIEMYTQLFSQN